jgi:SAM-dependent methyltransferase
MDVEPAYIKRVEAEVRDPRLRASVAAAEAFCPPEHRGEEGGFDAIVSSNVLEHIEDHARVLRNFRDMLRRDGVVLLLVPAHPFLFSSLDRHLLHFRRYSARGLRALAAATGLRVVRLRHFNPVGALGWWINGKLLGRAVLPAGQLSFYTRFAIPLSRLVDRLNPFPLGVSLLAALARSDGSVRSAEGESA